MMRFLKAMAFALLLLNPAFPVGAEISQGIMNKLLAPGPLMQGHQDLEHKDCLSCHEAGAGIPDAKCLKCHKEVGKAVTAKSGFHGKQTKPCATCHNDHKGRDFNATAFDHKKFDHDKTGFSLKGAHEKVECKSCHTETRANMDTRKGDIRFFGSKSQSCKSCHSKDDVHFFKGAPAKKECGTCHTGQTWKGATFNHKTETKFPLVGHHAKIKCKDCHAPKGPASARYQWPLAKSQCLSCHDNVHRTNLSPRFGGGRCETCHNQNTWTIAQFQHQAVTGFPLREAHSKLSCESCHKHAASTKNKKDINWTGKKKECASCHTDYHGFNQQLSIKLKSPLKECQRCHNETSWKESQRFNHSKDTQFILDGKHTALTCFKCHVPMSATKPPERKYRFPEFSMKTCASCHTSKHSPEFFKRFKTKKCESCHNTSDWQKFKVAEDGSGSAATSKSFDHARTRFPLTGKHKSVSCDSCHRVASKNLAQRSKDRYTFPSVNSGFCEDCHLNIHKKQFSQKFSIMECRSCHETTAFWPLRAFDHDNTDFALTGKHASISNSCFKCHTNSKSMLATKPRKIAHKFQFAGGEAGFCASCHLNEHKTQFNEKFSKRPCHECHTTEDFIHRNAFDHSATEFELLGKHQKVQCKECHRQGQERFKTPPQHAKSQYIFNNFDGRDCLQCHRDPHRGQFDNKCETCHVERGWNFTMNFHKRMLLSGVHFRVTCNECHAGGRILGGVGEECAVCHSKDDIHLGALPKCGDCHRQSFWEAASFEHSLTRFPLRGAHRSLECASCHAAGLFQGLPTMCADCHFKDAAGVGSPSHNTAPFQSCQNCHNEFSFKGAQ